jgi:EmrB/QacA subfamily drug resistance transporter
MQVQNQRMVLGIILATYLMIVLDATVVITALPSIHEGLNFSTADLSWVQSAYALTFGGLLLLGARAGDIIGRRTVFVLGIGIFTFASFLGGLAQSPAELLVARAVQGVGGAIAAPSTLALLTTSFREGAERNRALAAYSAVAGGGGSVGLVLGGLLTDVISWRAGLFVNVPVGVLLMWLAPRYLEDTEPQPGRFDAPGAVTSTLGMTALVYGFVRAASNGWGDAITMAAFAAGIALLIAFVANERRASQPITPLRLFASRERSGAYAARMLAVGGMFSMFFFMSQYLQGVRGYSPLETGVAFLPMTMIMFGMVRLVPRLAERLGNTALLMSGLSLAALGMTWLSRIGFDTPFFPGIAVPLMMLGLGMGAALAPLTGAGVAGVDAHDAGAASGLVNASQQLGVSLGLSILITVFASNGSAANPRELADGVAAAVTGSAVLLTLALAVIVFVVQRAGSSELAPVLDER